MIFRMALLMMLVLMATTSTAASINKQQTYIVHMDKAKIASSDNSRKWYEAVIDSITDVSAQKGDSTSSPQLLYVYETTTGFAAKLSRKQLESLRQLNGFLSATPDEMLKLHTTYSPQFLGLESGEGLWNATNLEIDVIIGVVDSGIWPEHDSFKDSSMSPVPSRWKGICEEGTNFTASNCNRKLIGARAYYEGYEAAGGIINETEDYKSARDAQGHGTHTASTAAGSLTKDASFLGLAKGLACGMRYTSRIAVYKVCWLGGCATSDILAAMDEAILDGVDVLSLSLGGYDRRYSSDSIAIGAFHAIRNGIFVSCSGGNSGPFSSAISNTAPWIMTVAASYLDRSFLATVKLGNGQIFKGSSLYTGQSTKQLPIVYGKSAGDEDAEYCYEGSLESKLVKGKIVLCESGELDRAEMADNVKSAGGAGTIMLNYDDDGEEQIAEAYLSPAVAVGNVAGKAIKNYVSSKKKATASITFNGTVYGNRAPAMAAFSSRGPSKIGPQVIKPDITAPGVNILAAWPPLNSPTYANDNRSVPFNVLSGTSMSCPHVSGIAALIKSVHSDWSPAAIKSALMTTAYTQDNTKIPILDVAASSSATPFAFGSGHVNPETASNPGLIYNITEEDYLNHLCSMGYTSAEIALFAGSDSSFSCPSTSTPLGDLNYPSFAVNLNRNAQNKIVTFKRTVTNVGVPGSSYKVRVQAPKDVSVTVKPTALNFNKLGEELSYTVSFVGRRGKTSGGAPYSFGTLLWASGKYSVESPIAVSWS